MTNQRQFCRTPYPGLFRSAQVSRRYPWKAIPQVPGNTNRTTVVYPSDSVMLFSLYPRRRGRPPFPDSASETVTLVIVAYRGALKALHQRFHLA